MTPYLFHIYGPFYANYYGLAICLGILSFTYLVEHDPRRLKLITSNKLQILILWGTLAGVLGGRLLWLATNWPLPIYDILAIWDGGLSVLGAILAILLFAVVYLKKQKIPTLPFLDLIAIYAPLLQSISRVGCFLAGCCYGLPTNLFWGIVYNHPDSALPLSFKNISLHPTQIYSALILFIIFLILYNFVSKYFKKPGQILSIYLMLSSLERFLVDFWRADQEFCSISTIFSVHQVIAIGFLITGLILFLASMNSKNLSKR